MTQLDPISAYRRAVDFLESLPQLAPERPRDRGGPESGHRARDLLSRLGDPQRGPRFIHVGGTSGKGSTVHALHRMYQAAGYPVLSFTSPHLTTTLERFAFKEGLVPIPVFLEAVDTLKGAVTDAYLRGPHGAPGFFDALFALCLLCARALRADPVIVEVGLGGRLDATNQLEAPLVTAVTDIGLDHTAILGDTLAQIAADKGGIFKAGVPALTGATSPEAVETLRACAADVGAPFLSLGHGFELRRGPQGGHEFLGPGGAMALGGASLGSSHQRVNAALAVAVARSARERGLAIDDAHIQTGLSGGGAPGRFEWIHAAPPIVLDVAHNPDKLRAFVHRLEVEGRVSPHAPSGTVIFSLARDKDLDACVAVISPFFSTLVVTRPLSPFKRFWPPKEIAARAEGHFDAVVVTVDPDQALAEATAREGVGGWIAVTGSTYVVGYLRSRWEGEEVILQQGRLSPIGGR